MKKMVLAALISASSLSSGTALAMTYNHAESSYKAYGSIRIGYAIEHEEEQTVNVSKYFDTLEPSASGEAAANNKTWKNPKLTKSVVQDGSISTSDLKSGLFEDNQLTSTLKRDNGPTMSLALGVSMNNHCAAELQYTRFFGHQLKSEDDSTQWFVRTAPAIQGGGTAYDPDTAALNNALYPIGSSDFSNKGKAFTEIKRNIHTFLARGIVMHNFEPVEINANFGVGVAKITGERIVKNVPGTVRSGHNDPTPNGNADADKSNNPKQLEKKDDINKTSIAFSAGVGLGFHLSDDMKFVVGYDYTHMDKVEDIKNDMHHVSGGLVFSF